MEVEPVETVSHISDNYLDDKAFHFRDVEIMT